MNTKDVLISVIVPAYNSENFIKRCLDSIREQTYQNLEIIVVDDASVDNTERILAQVASQECRLKVFRAATNLGIHGARRLGMKHAEGSYIGFVDHDDYLDISMYSTLLRKIQTTGADISISGVVSVSNGRNIGTKVKFSSDKLIKDDIIGKFCRLKLGSGVLWNKLYSREIMDESLSIPLERSVDGSEDYILNFGAFSRASSVALCSARLYNYVLHSDNISSSGEPWARFARIFRAYVVCLEVYAVGNRMNGSLIDELYTRQLHFPVYRVGNSAMSDAIRQHIAESLHRLADVSPESLYSVLHSLPKWESRVRKVMGSSKLV